MNSDKMSIMLNFSLPYIYQILLASLIAYISYKIFVLYSKVWVMPPGPFPLPFIGNTLSLISLTTDHWSDIIAKNIKVYGPVMTFWIGNQPVVLISDPEIGRQAFNNPKLCGRLGGHMASCIANENIQDVALVNYGPSWVTLRKVTLAAMGKFSTNDNLAHLVCGCAEQTMKTILMKEGFNKQFIPFEFTDQLFRNIIASMTFGRVFSDQDEIIKLSRTIFKDASVKYGLRLFLWEVSPLSRLIDRKAVREHRNQLNALLELFLQSIQSHCKNYDPSIERDFCDALISTKNDALKEGKASAAYLNDDNFTACIMDLFFAGIESPKIVFDWILLLISYYPNIQKKLRQEIENEIGNRIPTNEDRSRCHYTMAVIYETLRLKNGGYAHIPHRAMANSKIGDYTICEGSAILLSERNISLNENHWPNAHEFRPERFLVDEQLITGHKAYVPFGVGRRNCSGEKLAIANIFLVLVKILQLTAKSEIVLGENNGLDSDKQDAIFIIPKQYKISIKKHHG